MSAVLRLAALSLIALVVAAPPLLAIEGSTVGVRPADPTESWIRARLKPGAASSTTAVVVNLSDTSQRVRIGAADGITTPDGTFTLASEEAAATDVGAWLRPEVTTLTLPPHSERAIAVGIRVPADAAPGDHAGGLVVRSLQPTATTDSGGVAIDVVERVGLRVYLTVPGRRDGTVAVEDLQVGTGGGGPLRSTLGLPTHVEARFTARHTGNVAHDDVAAHVDLLQGDRVLATTPVGLGTLLPSSERQVVAQLPISSWRPQDYRVRVRVDDGTGTQESVPVDVSPWRIVAIGVVALGIVALCVVLWRRRRLGRASLSLVVVLAVACAVGAPVGPARSAGPGLSVAIAPGDLTARAPAELALPRARLDGDDVTVHGTLGEISVTDARASAPGWTLVATATPPRDPLGAPMASHLAISATASNGDGSVAGPPGRLDAPRVVLSAPPGRGRGTSRAVATVTLGIPADTPSARFETTLLLTVS